MTVNYTADLVAIIPVSFTNNEGETVEYNELYFVVEDENEVPSMLKFNSKLPLVTLGEHKICIDVDVSGGKRSRLVSIT